MTATLSVDSEIESMLLAGHCAYLANVAPAAAAHAPARRGDRGDMPRISAGRERPTRWWYRIFLSLECK
jgi:hypothetical protein